MQTLAGISQGLGFKKPIFHVDEYLSESWMAPSRNKKCKIEDLHINKETHSEFKTNRLQKFLEDSSMDFDISYPARND